MDGKIFEQKLEEGTEKVEKFGFFIFRHVASRSTSFRSVKRNGREAQDFKQHLVASRDENSAL
jgi:hypothetical protein